MKITAPKGQAESLQGILGLEVEGVPVAPDIPVVAADLGPDPMKSVSCLGVQVPDDTVIHRETGQFLVLGRFPNDDMTYDILQVVPPGVFLKAMGKSTKGPMTASDMSDVLVQAFDRCLFEDLGIEGPVTYGFRTQDGILVQQHST